MKRPTLFFAILLCSLLISAFSYPGFAQTGEALVSTGSEQASSSDSVLNPKQLLRDLNQRGVAPQGTFVYDWSKVLNADGDSGLGFGRSSFDLMVPIDGKKMAGLEGSAAMLRLKSHLRQFGETYDGAAQLYSNIDAGSRTSLYEAWFEQRLMSDRLRLKAGRIDANTEFAVVSNAGDFLNSSMGYSPTIMEFPTYPTPQLGFNAFIQPKQGYSVGMGLFQTSLKHTLTIVEPGHNWNLGKAEQPGRASFGYWRVDGKVSRFDGSQAPGTQGFYTVIEQSVLRQPLGQGERRLATFLQMGWAEARVSSFTHHAGGGAILQGPWNRRSQDSIGLAATWVRFSQNTAAGFDLPSEFVLETYYKLAFDKHIALVPDFQFLHHPGGLSSNRDCPVLTPRLVISF